MVYNGDIFFFKIENQNLNFDGVRMEKEKVQGVVGWPIPKNVKDMQKFLGLANYYRRFVKDFARIAKPLHETTRKGKKWE